MTQANPAPSMTPPPTAAEQPSIFAAAIAPPVDYFGGAPTADDKNMAMLTYLLGLLTGFVGPLVLWLMKKEASPFIDDQGKEVLNFQISVFLASLALTITIIGVILLPVVVIAYYVLMIIGLLKAKDGVAYRFPFAVRLLK